VAHQGWLARLRGREDAAMTLGRQAVELTERYDVTWWRATACAMLGGTLLLAGDRTGAVKLFERGLAAAREAGVEAYLLRSAAPLAAATGSRLLLGEAAGLLERASNASTQLCVPNALSQRGGYALGAQAGEAAIRQVVTDAGFTRFRRAAETPFNLVYEVRP
jgi:hypothetical protein